MQSKEELAGDALIQARSAWTKAMYRAIESAKELTEAGLHKQYTNRVFENFMYVRQILSGTEFENFFALRAHEDAQPEFAELAYKMLEVYNKSEPKKLIGGMDWHIPFGDNIDQNKLMVLALPEAEKLDKMGFCGDISSYSAAMVELKKKIAVARCARVSYYNFEGKDDYEADIKLCDRLFANNPKHLSPTEHVAQACVDSSKFGNFTGFKQYRYFFKDQNLTDLRVVRKFQYAKTQKS